MCVQVEHPWLVDRALSWETGGCGPSPVPSFLSDLKQILSPSVHRTLESKEFLPRGAGDKQITTPVLLKPGSCGGAACARWEDFNVPVGPGSQPGPALSAIAQPEDTPLELLF